MADESTVTMAASPPAVTSALSPSEQVAAVALDPARGTSASATQHEPQTLRDAFGRRAFRITDLGGKEHLLPQVDLFDLMDLEDDLGPVAEWGKGAFSIRSLVAVFWISFRREGMTDDAVDAARRTGKWAHARSEINSVFGAASLKEIANVASDLLTNLGLSSGATDHPTTDGAEAAPAAASTGENS